MAVDAAANEVFVADTGNHRIVVFDSETGSLQARTGARTARSRGADPGAYDPNAPPARQFRDVTCVEIAKDGMVYVCDRTSNRIQVFQKDGKFVKEGDRRRRTRAAPSCTGQFGAVSSFGSVWDVAFSNDAQQRYLFVADGQDKKVVILSATRWRRSARIGERRPAAGTVPRGRQHRRRFARQRLHRRAAPRQARPEFVTGTLGPRLDEEKTTYET